MMILASFGTILTLAEPARASIKHTILVSVTSAEISEDLSQCATNDAVIKTTAKLRKGHIASTLEVEFFVGKTYKASRLVDPDIAGKTKVIFITCLAQGILTNAHGYIRKGAAVQIMTEPRGRDFMSATITQFRP